MTKYILWIIFWSLICGLFAAIQIDAQAGLFCFVLALALSLSPILACPDNEAGDDKKNNPK